MGEAIERLQEQGNLETAISSASFRWSGLWRRRLVTTGLLTFRLPVLNVERSVGDIRYDGWLVPVRSHFPALLAIRRITMLSGSS